jgi:DNA topoisomerase-3
MAIRTGIGTDATIAQHIQTIQDRKYATKQNNLFAPTTLGVALVAGYNAMGLTLSKPQLRAAMVFDHSLSSFTYALG